MSSPTTLFPVIGFTFSRWIPANQCINIDIAGNSFVLLPSVTDHYFTIDDTNNELVNNVNNEGFMDPSHLFKLLQLNDKNNEKKEVENSAKTFLVLPDYKKLPHNLLSSIEQYPSFYLSTLLSASLHQQDKCLQDLEDDNIHYFTEGCFTFLGNNQPRVI